jgi:hypothetical protein
MRFGPYPVKRSDKLAETAPSLPRWLEGWSLLGPSVGIALLAAWLALPQGAIPNYLPLPAVPRGDIAAAKREQQTLAHGARSHALDYETRMVGEAFRQLGRLSHAGEPITVDRRARFRALVQNASARRGTLPLKQLRAIQAELFVTSLSEWERTGVENSELIELGGDFLSVAHELGWVTSAARGVPKGASEGQRCSLNLDDDERLALFLTRWTDLAELSASPTVGVEKPWHLLAMRARLRQPLSRLGPNDLHLVDRVKSLVPDYPDLVSKGLILSRMGEHAQAISAFQAHLRTHPDGPLTLRARNHLIRAVEAMPDDDGR